MAIFPLVSDPDWQVSKIHCRRIQNQCEYILINQPSTFVKYFLKGKDKIKYLTTNLNSLTKYKVYKIQGGAYGHYIGTRYGGKFYLKTNLSTNQFNCINTQEEHKRNHITQAISDVLSGSRQEIKINCHTMEVI